MNHARRRLSCLPLIALLSGCASEGLATGESPVPRPNFVVILADDLGYGDLGIYGGGIPTPNLDALAAGGLRFTDFHSNGAVCSPTRAALVTGRYPHRAGIQGVVTARNHRDTGLDPRVITMAERLGEGGYATALFGKWHLGYEASFGPRVQGFDEFRGFVSGNVDYVSHIDQEGHEDWWRDDRLEADEGYATDLITDYGVDFIRRHPDEPFFLYLAHGAPHYPYQARGDPAYRRPGEPGNSGGPRRDDEGAYAELIIALDEGVGRIVAELDSLGLSGRTLVMFLSDNGPARLGSAGPWRGGKGSVWEGGHRVPAFASWPGVVAPGVTDQTAMGMDLLPTMLSLATGPAPRAELDGVDLSRLLLDGDPLPARDLLWTHGPRAALRRGPWKLVVEDPLAEDAIPMLFDLAIDPAEEQDIARRHPERARAMLEALRRILRELTDGVERRA